MNADRNWKFHSAGRVQINSGNYFQVLWMAFHNVTRPVAIIEWNHRWAAYWNARALMQIEMFWAPNTFQLSFNHLICRENLMRTYMWTDRQQSHFARIYRLANGTSFDHRPSQQQMSLHNLNAITFTIDRIWMNFRWVANRKPRKKNYCC